MAAKAPSRQRKAPKSAPAGERTSRRARRAARRRNQPWPIRVLRRTIYWGFVLAVWMCIGVAGIVGYYAVQMPATSDWKIPERPPNIQIIADDGTMIANRGDTGGETVRLKSLPRYVPNAVISIEDRRFRSHFGVDPIGLARALTKNALSHGVVEGGSTLTQQLAKNMFLSQERSLRRKVQEAILSVWLEAKYSKDDILAMYLNRVYFGSGAYGIDAAARTYFDKDAKDLTIAQAAMIAGLLPAPNALAPNRNPEGAKARAALVVANMRDQGYITPKEAADALANPGVAVTTHMTRSDNYVADWVMDVLSYHVATVDQDIVVETTIDLTLQAAAEKALRTALDENGAKYSISNGALVALDNSGAVRAMVGGRDYQQSQFNRATQARRQPGSAFKPFVYLAALERGATPDMIRVDEPVTFGDWSPKNSEDKYVGPVTLRVALARSINTVAAQLTVEVGPQTVVDTARRMGINSPLAANPSISLGTSEVTLLELTGAYAPFANGGVAALPYVIKKITTSGGKVLFDRSGSGLGRVASPESVGMMNQMLSATLQIGTGTKAQLPGWQAAGKTGTTQDFRDAWFIGYTSHLTAGVWVGNDDNSRAKHSYGGTLPAMIWSDFMIAAHQGVKPTPLPDMNVVAPMPTYEAPPGYGTDQVVDADGDGQPDYPADGTTADNQALDQWIAEHANNPGAPGQPQVLQQAPVQPQLVRVQKRGFFDKLFGR